MTDPILPDQVLEDDYIVTTATSSKTKKRKGPMKQPCGSRDKMRATGPGCAVRQPQNFLRAALNQVPCARMPENWLNILNDIQSSDTVDDYMEFFSPPRVAPLCRDLGLRAPRSLDLATGGDLVVPAQQLEALKDMAKKQTEVALVCPPCTMFSTLMYTNWAKMEPMERQWKLEHACKLLDFAAWIMKYQLMKSRYFIFEHPYRATSWERDNIAEIMQMEKVAWVEFDQCMLGLCTPIRKHFMKKRTRILTNMPVLIEALRPVQCDKSHTHASIQGNEGPHKRSRASQKYPPQMCELLAKAVFKTVKG